MKEELMELICDKMQSGCDLDNCPSGKQSAEYCEEVKRIAIAIDKELVCLARDRVETSKTIGYGKRMASGRLYFMADKED